jgi:hypothetical protein
MKEKSAQKVHEIGISPISPSKTTRWLLLSCTTVLLLSVELIGVTIGYVSDTRMGMPVRFAPLTSHGPGEMYTLWYFLIFINIHNK